MSKSSVISTFLSWHGRGFSRPSRSRFLFQIRLQKTFRHLLDTGVIVPSKPNRLRQIKFQIPIFDRPVIQLANVTEQQDAGPETGDISSGPQVNVARSGDCESNCIPHAVPWRPVATAGITKIAECFQNILRGQLAFVAGSRAVPAPSTAQRKPRGMRPGAVFESGHGHKVRTGQSPPFELRNLLGLAIVISCANSGECFSRGPSAPWREGCSNLVTGNYSTLFRRFSPTLWTASPHSTKS